ncbi:helix-turn-helix domain-containing protein [Larkinella sp.]|uniref:helix-turn-helix domain-containing protein n=1 Tax=Larkinella sp. TaxID=2034517 RepID=UPI003BA9FAE1
MNSFSRRLQDFMSKKNLKQADLVRATGVSRQAVNAWFKQDKRPDQDKLILIARLLEISVDELLGREDKPEVSTSESKQEVDYWKNKYIQLLEEKNQLLEEKNKLLQKQSEEQAKKIEHQKV